MEPEVRQGEGEDGIQVREEGGFTNFDRFLADVPQGVGQGARQQGHIPDASMGRQRSGDKRLDD